LDAFATDVLVIGSQEEVNLIPRVGEFSAVVTAHRSATDDGNFHGGLFGDFATSR
jgi:hypothetical protein